ncbi:MAG: inorganic phosphate transporter [Myxococcales bacterium]|nr:inorganic phosphate transporter [Myxococcales bacterium]MCB9709465.1 inorganic phosphate transporter [Myxococcales bacterium]
MEPSTIVAIVAIVTGLYMAWNIGANDVANAMGTSVGSGALTLKRALIVAAVFEFAGAMLVGGTVTDTVSKGIVDLESIDATSVELAMGMACCLLASAMWLHIASYMGWPVSTTHSIVGSVLGFGMIAGGPSSIHWPNVAVITTSWVISPILGALTAYAMFVHIRRRILSTENPLHAMHRHGPFLLFPVGAMLALSLIYKGLKPLHLDLSLRTSILIGLGVGALFVLVSAPLLGRMTREAHQLSLHKNLRRTEKVFLVLQIITASFVAFAHGSNDVANAVGPMAAVFHLLSGNPAAKVKISFYVLIVGACGIVFGLATYGYKVIATVGSKITELTPSRGFAAEFATASTILIASKLGLPISTTHTLVGAVIGVGLARSVGAIDTDVLRGIAASWFVTVPLTALLSAILYKLSSFLV